MGWLLHKFAEVTQTGTYLVSAAILSGAVGGMWTHDAAVDQPDNISGAKSDAIIQVFEQEIETLQDIKEQYGQVVADQSAAFIRSNETEINLLEEKATGIENKMDAVSERIEREVHLVPAISEQDFVTIAEKYNALFPLGTKAIDIEDARYLHEAQKKESMVNIAKEDRDEVSSSIQKKMTTLDNQDASIFLVIVGTVLSGLAGVWGAGTFSEISSLKRIANQPTPTSPFGNWQEGKTRRREKKQKQLNKLN